jgi:hypothetical protein
MSTVGLGDKAENINIKTIMRFPWFQPGAMVEN